jgi:hypothetical protein
MYKSKNKIDSVFRFSKAIKIYAMFPLDIDSIIILSISKGTLHIFFFPSVIF